MKISYSNSEQVALHPTSGGRSIQPSIEDRLLKRKVQLESDLKDVSEALSALQANPEILKIMCLISKVNY